VRRRRRLADAAVRRRRCNDELYAVMDVERERDGGTTGALLAGTAPAATAAAVRSAPARATKIRD
jgi:hypothetical protein